MSKLIWWEIFVDSNTYRVFDLYKLSRNLELLDMFSSNRTLLSSWEIIDLKLFDKEEGEDKKPLADFMGGFDVPTINAKAMELMKRTIENDVEFLPLKTEAGPYFALNVKYINCLDIDNSVLKRARDGSILWVEKYALKWNKMKDINMFRIKELGLTELFVSDIFKKIYDENNLRGLIYKPVPFID